MGDHTLLDYASTLGQMIALNAGFSFSSDVVAQLLEGKRCCGPTKAAVSHSAPASPTTGVAVKEDPPIVVQEPAKEDGAEVSSSTSGSTEEIEELPEPFDWERAIKFACTGVIFCGVMQFIRLEIIDAVFPKGKEMSWQMALYKTAFNQLIFSPIVRAMSMSTIQYIKTRDCNDVALKLKNDFFEAQAVSYAVKPVGNFLAFWIFPHNLVGQAVMIRSIAFIYNVYFSYMAHKEVHDKPHHKHHVEIVEEVEDEATETSNKTENDNNNNTNTTPASSTTTPAATTTTTN
eukprot:PhM_4_TR14563/c0_g1_i1/m.45604/K13348/MPV17; protein Mpv17